MRKTKTVWLAGLMAIVLVVITACGGSKDNGQSNSGASATVAPSETASESPSAEAAETTENAGERVIEYLGESYTVPANVERIVITGAVEAMEDSVVLDVHPVGAISFGGEFPERFVKIVDQAESIGEKREPNFEAILKLKPDVILGTTKFGEEIVEQLKKIAPFIAVSHIAANWEANLQLLGELSGKSEQAAAAIAQYRKDADEAELEFATHLADQKVLAIRIREGELNIYPKAVFVNPILYTDLGLNVPAEVEAATAQEVISNEQLAVINPDYLFIQFSNEENADTLTALDEFLANPIVKKVSAVKNDRVFVNVIDPLSEGGPALSRIEFLKVAQDLLSK
ncbi:ABC transporter substrate-binding protein [Cohnella herbarum]|uniref:ABC transporter substrate-binding protein n=1 Tax=Cohnella herbarum TaxID=2728023 RepID=A0A7Z2VMS7_9BACL|nr:ABC transporter substrate-binding protein [Cohnella herbarum]QJD85906.1 ABC transporter substrate-binding protein [Cohnella herbarum]